MYYWIIFTQKMHERVTQIYVDKKQHGYMQILHQLRQAIKTQYKYIVW